MWNVPAPSWLLKYTLGKISDVDEALNHKIEPCGEVNDADDT
jgi:hypothetical protein